MENEIRSSRQKKAKLNILVSLLFQVVTFICGFLIPKLMIDAFGSEAYGATSSITQFLAYIALLEGGIGGVARAALYKPLAQKNWKLVSSIVAEIRKFFRTIGWVFLVYVIFLAIFFHQLAHVEVLDWLSTALLVLAISISNFAQYFIGLPYITLVQAAQKTYITNLISTITTVLNAFLTILLILMGANLIIVKLVSSLVFIIRPIYVSWYVKKHYPLTKDVDVSQDFLEQKWSGLSQHIAFFLHSNTDIVILTLFANLKLVAVYSVYNMIVSHIQNICSSFATGMEAMFGDMLACKDYAELDKTFGYYETLISMISIILLSTTAVMIVPFIRLYTAGVTDANYIVPAFAMLLICVSILYCFRLPYHAVIIAAGHFRQTQIAAYGEAIINITLSLCLVHFFGLVGVVTATVIGTGFRFIYYVIYLSRHILHRPARRFIKRLLVNACAILVIFLLGELVIHLFTISNYFLWACGAVLVFICSGLCTLGFNWVFYRTQLRKILKKSFKRI